MNHFQTLLSNSTCAPTSRARRRLATRTQAPNSVWNILVMLLMVSTWRLSSPSPLPPRYVLRQSLALTKFGRYGSHFAVVWAIDLGIRRTWLAHTKAFVRAIRVGIGTGRLGEMAIRKLEPVSTKFRRFVGLYVVLEAGQNGICIFFW
jgi:hypothetical protein